MENKCLGCNEKLRKKRKTQKYCSMECFMKTGNFNKKPRIKKEDYPVCPVCVEPFKPNKKYQKYCSQKCANKNRGILSRKNNCGWCGAPVDRSKLLPGRPVLCTQCLKKYLKEVHYPRSNLNRQPIKVRCSICRNENKIKYRPVRERDCYQCAECRARKKNILKISMENKKEHFALSKSFCTVCNTKLSDKNKTHKASHQKCDACMYYSRRIYKTKTRFGIDTSTSEKLVGVDILSASGLSKLNSKQRKERLCENRNKMAEKLLKLRP